MKGQIYQKSKIIVPRRRRRGNMEEYNMKKIKCLFAEGRLEKYIVRGRRKIGFAHLQDMLAFLDGKYGKKNYKLQFNYA